MSPICPYSVKTFIHPAKVFRLEYPAHWDQVQQDEGRSHERDDVGLWISIMPMSIDTSKLTDDLQELMKKALPLQEAGPMERDPTLKHVPVALRAAILKEGQGGNYWIAAGGDVVLFASTQVPVAERDQWNPMFERLMASLQITRDDELLFRQLANELLELLRKKYPDQDFQHDEKGIRGKNQVIYLSNLLRDVKAAPDRRAKIIKHFVESIGEPPDIPMGEETWEEARVRLIPVLKPRDYVKDNGPTRDQLVREWLGDVVICYVLRIKNLLRFVTNWDVRRWETDADTVHQVALDNLSRLPWPSRMEGSRQKDGGRVVLVQTTDSLSSSRLLHPELHRLFSQGLGRTFWAGIPDRDTLVLFSDRRSLKSRIGRRLAIDCRKSSYPITEQAFLVTQDGIAAG
jgi:uncharacterized protein YtpQ (UPF0354 family)